MTHLHGLEALYLALGQALGIDGLRPDDAGCCRLVFDRNLMVQIRPAAAPPRLLLSGSLDAEPASGQADLLLRANAWSAGSGGGWFALDERGRVCLQAALPMDGLAAAQLAAAIETLLDTLETWSKRLRQQAASHWPRPHELMQRI